MKDIAVVILNWNGAKMLRSFLPSVLHYSDLADVIVADNASSDASLEVMQKEFPQVRMILLPKNFGFAEGYNQCLSQIKEYKYYILLNSDVEVTEGWLDPLYTYMEAHPEVAACQPKLLAYHHKTQFEYAGAAGGYLDYLGYPFCRGRLMASVEEDRGQYDTVQSVFWATGAAMMIRSTDYWHAGGLDGDFFAHMEEIDLCWRLRSMGRKIVCIPQSVVYHVGGGTLPKENPRKTYLNFRNNLLMLYKNLPDTQLHAILWRRMLLDGVAAFSFLLKGEFGNISAVWRAHRDFRSMRPIYQKKRQYVQQQAVLSDIPEQVSYSLLAKYYLKGIRKYTDLPRKI